MTIEIFNRREKISHLLVKGMNESTIAKTLDISRQTVVRDVSYLKKSSHGWISGLAKNGFIYEYKLGLDKIKDHEIELHKLFDTSEKTELKIRILKALDENVKLYLQLLGESPAIYAFKKAIAERKLNNV